jgi:hypothetical protein
MHMFVLRIPVTPAHVDALKTDLIKALPEVKSSHRVEALGRGLGFKTYAALRAVAQSTVPSMATVSGASFSGPGQNAETFDSRHRLRAT